MNDSSMTTFMKEDPTALPQDLLTIRSPFPIEITGPGQLCRNYDVWAYARCSAAHLPVRKTAGAAGHQLYSLKAVVVPAKGSATIHTDVCVQLPKGHYGKIEGLSSLGMKHSVAPFGGIIDEDYHGEIVVKLFNHGVKNFAVSENDCIAQLVIQKYARPIFQNISESCHTDRVFGGFGSTGR